MPITELTRLDAQIDDVELRRVLAHVEAHPETWRQDAWRSSCGTAFCFAGWVCELNHVRWTFPAMYVSSHVITIGGGDYTTAESYALKRLGIAHRWGDRVPSRTHLFWGRNTLVDLRRIVDELCGYAEVARETIRQKEIRLGNIGEPQREVTFEPLPAEEPVEEPAAPAPVTTPAPEREPVAA